VRISIITISFNNSKDIRRTIESVLNQNYPDIEYIIVDGGSTDGTLEIISEYGESISHIISEPDRNLYDAINKGLKIASGDIVGLIHAGDRLFNSDVIKKVAEHFNCHDIDVSYGHSMIVRKDDVPIRINRSPEYSKGLVRRGWMPSHQSIYLKRKLLEQFGYYDISLHPYSDYEFFLRYFYFNDLRIKRLDEYIIKFSKGGISTRNYINNLKAQKLHRDCWVMHGEQPPFYMIPLKLLRKTLQFAKAAQFRLGIIK
jgi:glycosyltransferase